MSVQFSGWEVIDDGASFPGVKLNPAQKPQNRGVYTMYHGTSISSAKLIISNGFKPSANGMLGKGVYVSRDKNKALNYPLGVNANNRVVLEVRVRVGRVKRIDKAGHPLQHIWNSKGYDTAWVPPNCGMVQSGREEDCVFDPKRITVVGIAVAPNTTTQKDLQQLLDQKSKKGQDGAANLCPLCKRKTQKDAPHSTQQCWACGQNICILMSKHFCPAKP